MVELYPEALTPNDPEPPQDTTRSAPPKNWSGVAFSQFYKVGKTGVPLTVDEFSATAGNAATAVDGRALQWFAEQIRTLNEPVRIAREKLDAIEPESGRFRAGQVMRTKPTADSGVIASFSTALRNLLPALDDLAAAMDQLAKDYDTAEELNSEAGLKALGSALNDFDRTTTGTTAA